MDEKMPLRDGMTVLVRGMGKSLSAGVVAKNYLGDIRYSDDVYDYIRIKIDGNCWWVPEKDIVKSFSNIR